MAAAPAFAFGTDNFVAGNEAAKAAAVYAEQEAVPDTAYCDTCAAGGTSGRYDSVPGT